MPVVTVEEEVEGVVEEEEVVAEEEGIEGIGVEEEEDSVGREAISEGDDEDEDEGGDESESEEGEVVTREGVSTVAGGEASSGLERSSPEAPSARMGGLSPSAVDITDMQ